MVKTRDFPLKTGTCTAKEESFARHYAQHSNGAQAIRDAGMCANGSIATLTARGWELLQYPRVQLRVEHWRHVFSKAADISDQRILAEYAAVAFSDPAGILDLDQGGVLPLSDMPESIRRSIKKISVRQLKTQNNCEGLSKVEVEQQIITVEFHDKLRALDRFADINGLTTEKKPPKNLTVKLLQTPPKE